LAQTVSNRSTDSVNNPLPPVLTGAEPRIAAPNIPQHLQTLVQQQMNALETHQVLWQGQVWQDQEMRWEVREESPQHNSPNSEEGHWVTQIHLDLPNLGGVSAKLSFNGNALNLSLEVSDAQSRDKLGNASTQLLTALSERGIPVVHTQITQHEHAG
jgi:flagellar hook-length control protein FliK